MSLRVSRLSDEIRDILASCFLAERLSDPRIKGVTITSVILSSDLQIAKVYYRVYDVSQKDMALQGLNRASGYLKKQLSGLDLRRIPELKFFYDDGIEKKENIERLLYEINQQNK